MNAICMEPMHFEDYKDIELRLLGRSYSAKCSIVENANPAILTKECASLEEKFLMLFFNACTISHHIHKKSLSM